MWSIWVKKNKNKNTYFITVIDVQSHVHLVIHSLQQQNAREKYDLPIHNSENKLVPFVYAIIKAKQN